MRRTLIVGVFAAALVSLMISGAFASAPTAEKPSPQEVIKALSEGNTRFAAGNATHPNADVARLAQAATESQGDHAVATVITCSDSRVPPELLFDMGVMDLFVIRVAGNVANTDEIGSIEYGLAHVNTPVLVFLGHTQCGAVATVTKALTGTQLELERNIPPLLAPIVPAVEKTLAANPGAEVDHVIPKAIVANVWQGIEDLFLRSAVTRQLVKDGKVIVAPAIYDVGSGKVEWLPIEDVAELLALVEANPDRAMNPMATPAEMAEAGLGPKVDDPNGELKLVLSGLEKQFTSLRSGIDSVNAQLTEQNKQNDAKMSALLGQVNSELEQAVKKIEEPKSGGGAGWFMVVMLLILVGVILWVGKATLDNLETKVEALARKE